PGRPRLRARRGARARPDAPGAGVGAGARPRPAHLARRTARPPRRLARHAVASNAGWCSCARSPTMRRSSSERSHMRGRLLAVCGGVAVAASLTAVLAAQGANVNANARAVCPGPESGAAHCHAMVGTDAHGNPLASTSPTGLSPQTVKNVYSFPTSSTAGAGETIAIVDAFDDPNAEKD